MKGRGKRREGKGAHTGDCLTPAILSVSYERGEWGLSNPRIIS